MQSAPQLTGIEETCVLQGGDYQLTLQGKQLTNKQWVGSDYAEAYRSHFFFNGTGILMRLVTGESQCFEFGTWSEEKYADRTLEEFVLRFPTWEDGRYKKEPEFNEEDKPRLVDVLCEDINMMLLCQDSPIPVYSFTHLPPILQRLLSA